MVLTLLPEARASFEKRSKVVRSSWLYPRVQHGLISLLLGNSPEDASLEATEKATSWLDNVVRELEREFPSGSERRVNFDDKNLLTTSEVMHS